MNLNFSPNDIVFYPQEDSFMSHNERKYLPQHLSEILPAFIATLPAVVEVGQGAKVAVAESDVEEYPGLWLQGTGGTGARRDVSSVPVEGETRDTSSMSASPRRRTTSPSPKGRAHIRGACWASSTRIRTC